MAAKCMQMDHETEGLLGQLADQMRSGVERRLPERADECNDPRRWQMSQS